MPEFVFGVDVDSVLVELTGPVLSLLNERFGTDFGLEDPVTQSGEGWLLREEIRDFYWGLFHDEAFLAKAPPVSGCQEGMRCLRRLGRIHIVTARLPALFTSTAKWLETNGIPYDEIIFASDKVAVAAEHGIGHFLEDTPEQALALAEAGVEVFLFDHPWNRLLEHPRVRRVAGWSELIARLAGYDQDGDTETQRGTKGLV